MRVAEARADKQETLRIHREPVETSGAATRPKPSLWQRPPVIIGLAALVSIAIMFAGLVVFHSLTHESTDDAFVDAHIVSIAPKIAGRVKAVHVDDNQLVRRDDVLIEIDSRDFEAALAQAKGTLAKAQATQKKTDEDRRRALDLFNQQVISAQERDNALQAAAAASGDTEADKAALQQAELNLGYTKIIAPINGFVTNKAVEAGDYVQVGQTLMALVPQQVWITANFKETQLRQMRPGQAVTISVDAYPGQKLRGHVDSIQAGSGARFSLLPPENATGNYVKVVQRVPVKIVLDESADARHVLGPGMSVVPDVQVAHGLGAAVKVIVAMVLAISMVVIGAALWIGKIRLMSNGTGEG